MAKKKGCPCVKSSKTGKCHMRVAKVPKVRKSKGGRKKKVCKSKGEVIPCVCQKLRGEERQGCIMAGGK